MNQNLELTWIRKDEQSRLESRILVESYSDVILKVPIATHINCRRQASPTQRQPFFFEKMEAIYNYLTGSEFRQRIEAIVEAFRSMREDLEHEKRAMMKIWSKREKQIERVLDNTARMYGDMQGIMPTLPEINALELGPGADAPDKD